MDTRTAQALIRFGLGRRGDSPLPGDPVAWLAGQLDGPDPGLAVPGATTAEGLTALRDDRAEGRANPEAKPDRVGSQVRADRAALINYVLTTDSGFRERLVWFWANHFTVSLKRGEINCVVVPYLREAIRPHVTGRFSDMLMAVMTHPAMLMYLDNQGSVGPDSPAGLKNHLGLNENLARECLELHTVTPAAGYTQADVTSFARILTGWSIEMQGPEPGYKFRLATHEPGTKVLMGVTFPTGRAGGVDALEWLANHPATHHHLAVQLVRHFVADDPPKDAVARVEAVLRSTHGDLKAASLEVVRLPQAWEPLTKLRTPADYVVSATRALDLPAEQRAPDPAGAMGVLGQPIFTAPLPNGWSDQAVEWAGGEAMMRRVDWAYALAGRGGALDPDEVAARSLGPLLTENTREAMHRAGSRRDALALLLASPEFNRR